MKNRLFKHRGFDREAKLFGSRVYCPCELCCLDFHRMLYPMAGGEPIRFRRIPGFAGNFAWRPRIPIG
jgi:hypothetical protein